MAGMLWVNFALSVRLYVTDSKQSCWQLLENSEIYGRGPWSVSALLSAIRGLLVEDES